MGSVTEDFLRVNGEFMEQHFEGKSFATWLLERGKLYEWKPLEDKSLLGRSKECFQNATYAALWRDGKFTYCEGYAFAGFFPVQHAWVIDNEDGKAVDVTWQSGGKLCGFCLGDGTIEKEIADYEFEEETCDWCKGSGEQDYEHHDLTNAEYFGIEIDDATLRKWILKLKHYGILEEMFAEERSKVCQH
jgi:hypothetical protein